MIKIVVLIACFIVFNYYLFKETLHYRELKSLSKQAKELSEKTRKSIKTGVVVDVVSISEVKDYGKYNGVTFVAGLFIFFLAFYSEDLLVTIAVLFSVMPLYLQRRYDSFFEILPNGLILNNGFVRWEDIKSYERNKITSSHKHYGYDLEVNNATELVFKLTTKRNSTISYSITNKEVEDDLVSLLKEKGVVEEKDRC